MYREVYIPHASEHFLLGAAIAGTARTVPENFCRLLPEQQRQHGGLHSFRAITQLFCREEQPFREEVKPHQKILWEITPSSNAHAAS